MKQKEELRKLEEAKRMSEETSKEAEKKKKGEIEASLLALNRLIGCIFLFIVVMLNIIIWVYVSS